MDASSKVADYVRDYEFRGDGGDYTPSEPERALLEDAINGFIADPGLIFMSANRTAQSIKSTARFSHDPHQT